MNLDKAIAHLHGRDDWVAVLNYLEKEREGCLSDFQDPERLENPQALARLAAKGIIVTLREAHEGTVFVLKRADGTTLQASRVLATMPLRVRCA